MPSIAGLEYGLHGMVEWTMEFVYSRRHHF